MRKISILIAGGHTLVQEARALFLDARPVQNKSQELCRRNAPTIWH